MVLFCFREVDYCWFYFGAREFCRSKIVLCMPLVLKVTSLWVGVGIRLCPRCDVPLSCVSVWLVRLWDFGWESLVFDASFCIVVLGAFLLLILLVVNAQLHKHEQGKVTQTSVQCWAI